MNKPLSETHPTLWKIIEPTGWQEYIPDIDTMNTIENYIQSCTVDIKEVERLNKRVFVMEANELLLKKEIERLRELDCNCDKYYQGIDKGERRAMERVKVAIIKLDKQFSKGAFQPTLRSLYKELGLGLDDEGAE